MSEFNKNIGMEAEYAFIKELNERGIPYTFVDDWYDFEVLGAKVEVKSTKLIHKFHTGKGVKTYKTGRFILTDEQKSRKIWIAFFLRWEERYFFLGMAKHNHNHKRKYIPLSQIKRLQLISLEEFTKEVR